MLITSCNSESEAVSEAWNAFVCSAASATISHLYEWRRIITDAYGHRTFYLTVRQNSNIVGILPLVQVKSRLFGNTLSSMPFQDYGGIIANSIDECRELLDGALQLKKECKAESLELRYRNAVFANEGKIRKDKATLIMDISKGSEALWKSFSPKLRNQIRKAQKSGLSTQYGGAELLEDFYRPFAANMRDLGSPIHHPEFFKKMFSEFRENARVLLVKEERRIIGGLIALFHKETVVVPWASSLRHYFSKCPNNLLYWDAIQHACDRGYRLFDFGRSSIGSGTYNFKLQWGAQPVQLHWQVFAKTIRTKENANLRFASAIWKHCPVALTNYLGPYIRKFLIN